MIASDLRYTLRSLIRQRGFSAIAILTLAIALASNTAIFSVVNAILLRPLPFAAPERLVNLQAMNRLDGRTFPVYSYPNYADVRSQSKTLEHVAAFSRTSSFLMEGAEPMFMPGLRVTANLPQLLGIKPQLGRFFTAAEDREGGAPVMVISHELWQQSFNGELSVIGRAVRVGTAGDVRTIVGVMPPNFRFPIDEDQRAFYTPFEQSVNRGRNERSSIWINVVARARAGVSLDQVSAELKTIAARLEKQYADDNTGIGFTASSMHEDVVRDVRPALVMLFGAVAVVLLIGCANVANLLLARATARHKEISIRAALGASPARITMQLLVESVVLSLLAGAVGLLLASWGIDALLAFAPDDIPRLDAVSLDARVLLFTTLLSIATGIVFGLAPAISASRPNLTEALKEGTRGSTEGKRNRLRSMLVVAAVALSLMLLAGAGLLLRSFVHVTGIDAGYDYRNAISFDFVPRAQAWPEAADAVRYHDRMMQELRSLPGVEYAGSAESLPLTPQESVWSFGIVGRPPALPGREPSSKSVVVSPGFFAAMRIPLVRGRDVAPTDRTDTTRIVVVNQAFVRQFFPTEEAIGKRLQLAPDDAVEIVGVVGDVRWRSLTEEPPATMFFPLSQRPRRSMSIVVRGANAEAMGPTLRAFLKRLDSQQPLNRMDTLAGTRGESLATRRFNLILLAVLAVVALLLAAVGIYSVMNYTVTQRTTEIGIRMALGAEARDVFRLIVGHAGRLVLAGVAIGVGGALATSRALSSLLYGVKAADPWTFAAIVVLIGGTALLASYIPARRAARVDPLVAIRYDQRG
jgi:putative ABC transport system permease protein